MMLQWELVPRIGFDRFHGSTRITELLPTSRIGTIAPLPRDRNRNSNQSQKNKRENDRYPKASRLGRHFSGIWHRLLHFPPDGFHISWKWLCHVFFHV